MAASSNPSAGGHSYISDGVGGGGGGGASATENLGVEPAQRGLRHNPGISLDWTPEEQSTLEELLVRYASETTNIARYAKIAQALRNKTVRDVALRCRWMSRKENVKRRKDDDSSSRKSRDKKEKVTEPSPRLSQVPNRTIGPVYAQPTISTGSNDSIKSKAADEAAGLLLEHNELALFQINVNFSGSKLYENFSLFSQARANILAMINDTSDLPEPMNKMPPCQVKLNEALVGFIFRKS